MPHHLAEIFSEQLVKVCISFLASQRDACHDSASASENIVTDLFALFFGSDNADLEYKRAQHPVCLREAYSFAAPVQ